MQTEGDGRIWPTRWKVQAPVHSMGSHCKILSREEMKADYAFRKLMVTIPIPAIYTPNMESASMLIAALCPVAKRWKQLKHPSVHEW